jgi:hypothetical protein
MAAGVVLAGVSSLASAHVTVGIGIGGPIVAAPYYAPPPVVYGPPAYYGPPPVYYGYGPRPRYWHRGYYGYGGPRYWGPHHGGWRR